MKLRKLKKIRSAYQLKKIRRAYHTVFFSYTEMYSSEISRLYKEWFKLLAQDAVKIDLGDKPPSTNFSFL